MRVRLGCRRGGRSAEALGGGAGTRRGGGQETRRGESKETRCGAELEGFDSGIRCCFRKEGLGRCVLEPPQEADWLAECSNDLGVGLGFWPFIADISFPHFKSDLADSWLDTFYC